MKLYKAIRFLMLSGILTLVLSRCIRESLEGCPLDTLLRFTYKPRGSAADLFGERVQRVRLCVYRPDGSIEHMQTLEKSELDRLQGVEMYLPQGNYTVVLWANASDAQTKLGGFSEANNVVNSQCAGTQAVFLFATVHECTHRRKAIIISPNIGSTYALGPVELMRR